MSAREEAHTPSQKVGERTTAAVSPYVACFICVVISASHAAEVIRIANGDTLTVLVDQKPVKIRLANIDASERKQAFGKRSRQSLAELCFRKDATPSAEP